MVGKYARMIRRMTVMAAELGNEQMHFLNDEAAHKAICEAVRTLSGSAAQMRSAEKAHSNEPNPLVDSRLPPPNWNG